MHLACNFEYQFVKRWKFTKMSQTTRLANSEKPVPQAVPAEIVALDPRPVEEVRSSKKYVRLLQLSDILSRHLDMRLVVEAFMAEIINEVDWCGYRFDCRDAGLRIESGVTDGFEASYRLRLQDRLLGELSVFKPARITGAELCGLEELLCALVYPLKNALLYEIALKSAYRDPLTGLNNRTAMEKFLPREIDLAKRHQQPMAILVMDLDGFKQINDTHGHEVGDRVLREASQVVSRVVRNTDLVYRYGGDEFVGGLVQTDIHGAVDVSERIRSSIADVDLDSWGVAGSIQISIGITLVRQNDDFLCAFKRADKALYQAKLNGKNQILIC